MVDSKMKHYFFRKYSFIAMHIEHVVNAHAHTPTHTISLSLTHTKYTYTAIRIRRKLSNFDVSTVRIDVSFKLSWKSRICDSMFCDLDNNNKKTKSIFRSISTCVSVNSSVNMFPSSSLYTSFKLKYQRTINVI